MRFVSYMSKSLDISEKTWDAIADSFDLTRKKPWKQVVSFIQSIAPIDNLLDIGCGNGRHIISSSSMVKNVIGIDISTNLLKITKRHILKQEIRNVSLIHASSLDIPIASNSVDVILYIASLHNISGQTNRLISLRELRRILKSQGKAMISVWSQDQPRFKKQIQQSVQSQNSEMGDIFVHWRQHDLNVPRFYHLYNKKEFIEDIRKARLRIINIEEIQLSSKTVNDNYFAIVEKQFS